MFNAKYRNPKDRVNEAKGDWRHVTIALLILMFIGFFVVLGWTTIGFLKGMGIIR